MRTGSTHARARLLFAILVATAAGSVLLAQTSPAVAAGVAQTTPPAAAAALGQQSFASILLSFYTPRILEYLKEWDRFPLIERGAAQANRLVAIGVSILQGAGLTWAYHSGADGWSFVMGSHHSTFGEFALAVATAFAAQQYFYEQLPSTQAHANAFAAARLSSAAGGKA